MSLVENLAARVQATADDLPIGQIAVAVERLRAATELLIWVRQQSADPLAVPQLLGAVEHVEQAGYAVEVTRQSIADYLASIGIGQAAGTDGSWRAALTDRDQPTGSDGERQPGHADAPRLGNWWAVRVAELTDSGQIDQDGPAGTVSDTAHLLRQVATAVARTDRTALHRDLAGVAAPTGLGLAAITPPVLHRLAGDLLDHEPRPEDLPALTSATAARVRELLPGMPEPVLQTLLARICRVPVEQQVAADRHDEPPPPPHPADTAVAGAVLTGVVLRLLDRDPQTLRPEQPQALRGRDA
ncbi:MULTISPECIES: hypothetical protein [unclassified Solwaraspora]|uniref:hypothetical protein n=1 Tax=unclassified Solwaraspora TaxID=2627926 RepID=UPI00259AFDF4|nr:hypothetical protein [Solwaraspora sp. WMMA2056]WJK39033.1 hypothetical protein O7608_21415 [Solwaraspora sp. WMMA2056]